MYIYKRFYKNYPIEKWAQDNLTPAEYTTFLISKTNSENIWNNYVDQGLVISEPIYESVFSKELNSNIDIEVGVVDKISDAYSGPEIQLDPVYYAFLNRYNQDQNADIVAVELEVN